MLKQLIVRNSCKFHGVTVLAKRSQNSSLRSCSSILNVQGVPIVKPLTKTDNLNAIYTRNIAVSAPRYMSAGGGGNYSTLWTIERFLTLGLLGVIPTAFVMPSQTMDALLAVSLVAHAHWGIEAIVIDYVRPAVVGNLIPKIAHASLYLLSMATLGGLFYLVYNDIGIAKSVRKLWAVKGV